MRCGKELVQSLGRIASGGMAGVHDIAITDLAADWLDLVAEIEHYKDRERHFAKALQVADGGDYRADWDGAISRVIAERDSLRKRLADAEAFVRDQAENGMRADITPSRIVKTNETGAEATLWFYGYLEQIDASIRKRARRELNRAKEGK